MRQSACLVVNPITVDNFCALFNCKPVDRASYYDSPDLKLFFLVGYDRSSYVFCLVHQGSTGDLLCLADQGSASVTQHLVSVKPSSLLFHSIKIDLFSVMIH